MHPTKFRFIQQGGFRGEDFQKSTNLKQELSVGTMFVNGLGINEQSLQKTFHRCFLPSFGSFWPKGFRREESKISAYQKQELHVAAMFATGSGRNEQSLQMLPTKLRNIWHSGFRREDFQKSTNQKQILRVAAMFVNGSGRNEHSLQRKFHRCFRPSFGSFG